MRSINWRLLKNTFFYKSAWNKSWSSFLQKFVKCQLKIFWLKVELILRLGRLTILELTHKSQKIKSVLKKLKTKKLKHERRRCKQCKSMLTTKSSQAQISTKKAFKHLKASKREKWRRKEKHQQSWSMLQPQSLCILPSKSSSVKLAHRHSLASKSQSQS